MSSPTQRSKGLLEENGYLVAIVEHWNPWAKVRQDLYGIADLLAVRPNETVAIQTTTYPHMMERVEKILASPNRVRLLDAGWHIIVHGWKAPNKSTRTWTLRSIDIGAQEQNRCSLAATLGDR
jgi:hypothetical protein